MLRFGNHFWLGGRAAGGPSGRSPDAPVRPPQALPLAYFQQRRRVKCWHAHQRRGAPVRLHRRHAAERGTAGAAVSGAKPSCPYASTRACAVVLVMIPVSPAAQIMGRRHPVSQIQRAHADAVAIAERKPRHAAGDQDARASPLESARYGLKIHWHPAPEQPGAALIDAARSGPACNFSPPPP